METAQVRTLATDAPGDATSALTGDLGWSSVYRLAAAAALTTILVGIAEIFITALPGGARVAPSSFSVVDWFTLFHDNWFMGLRNLGLLNIVLNLLSIPIFFALYGAHRRTHAAPAALAMILSFIGLAIFFSTNRAFSMLDLANQYAAATTDARRALIAAAGQAMLAVGTSHTPGTFLAFFVGEAAGIAMGLVMLQARIFSRAAGWAGIVGFGCLMAFEVCSSFVAPLFDVALIFALIGGLSTMLWDVLIARAFWGLARTEPFRFTSPSLAKN